MTGRQTGGQTQGYGIYRASTSSRDKNTDKKKKKLYAQQSNKRDQIELQIWSRRQGHLSVSVIKPAGESGCKSYISDDQARTIRYDTRCYFNARSKADMNQLNLPHWTDK